LANPCKGPANPFKAAEKDRYGSANADPTKCEVCAETLPPSWSA